MSVHTSIFGGVRLTDEDAKRFKNQVKYGRPKKEASQSLANGHKLLQEYNRNGFVKINAKSR